MKRPIGFWSLESRFSRLPFSVTFDLSAKENVSFWHSASISLMALHGSIATDCEPTTLDLVSLITSYAATTWRTAARLHSSSNNTSLLHHPNPSSNATRHCSPKACVFINGNSFPSHVEANRKNTPVSIPSCRLHFLSETKSTFAGTTYVHFQLSCALSSVLILTTQSR